MQPDQLLRIYEGIGKRSITCAVLVAHSGHPAGFVDQMIQVATGLTGSNSDGANPLADATIIEITDEGIAAGRTKLGLAMRLVND